MLRPLMKITLALALVMAGFTGLILAWPYDTADLLSALPNRDGCPAPCWQGIRPGTTTLDEAMALLAQNEWVGQTVADDTRIHWAWSGRQPALIDADQPGVMSVSEGVIGSIRIPLKIGMGDLAKTFGTPYWRSTNHAGASAIIRLSYPREYLMLAVTTRCPTNRAAFWLARPEITLQAAFTSGSLFTPDLLRRSVACQYS